MESAFYAILEYQIRRNCDTKRLFTCECCGLNASGSARELRELGWNTPPYTLWATICDRCDVRGTRLYKELHGAEASLN